jgi:hypothetical protein
MQLNEALKFQSISYESEAVVAIVGSTNEPLKYVGPAGQLSHGQRGKFTAFAGDHPPVEWNSPTNHQSSYRAYAFEDSTGKPLLIVKSLVEK